MYPTLCLRSWRHLVDGLRHGELRQIGGHCLRHSAMGGVQQGELGLASLASKPHALCHKSIHCREIYLWRVETYLIRNLRAAQLALEIYLRKSTIWTEPPCVLERELWSQLGEIRWDQVTNGCGRDQQLQLFVSWDPKTAHWSFRYIRTDQR